MTRYSATTEFRPGWHKNAERLVWAARIITGFERVWPALWPATAIAGLAVAAALFGLFEPLPWALHALILAGLATAIALTLYFHLETIALPRWQDGARRLERDSALCHRPLSEADDQLAAGADDPFAEELWRAHLQARLAALPRLRLSLPRSDLPKKDPRGLRYGVVVLILFGLIAARGDTLRRLETLFTPNPGVIATLDAWIEPPAYTGEAPVYLGSSGSYSLPAGSVIKVRVHGADHRPSMTVDGARFEGGHGEYAAEAKLSEGGTVRVRAGGRSIGRWDITLIPDHPPTISFAAAPATTERQALKLTYVSSDDYGIASLRAVIKPHNGSGAPLIVELPLPERSARPVTQTSFHDLTEHPYAGLEVDITLEATDGGGNRAVSNTVTFKLPQRVFTDPLARALIELRRNLAAQGAAAKGRTVRTLDALSYAPELFYEDKSTVYLALRMAARGASSATTREDYERLEALLWQTALALEQGGLIDMAAQLRHLQQMLTQMMAQGAPQADIDAVLQRYNELMQQYLAALTANGGSPGGAADSNARSLSDTDLAALLKAIQELSQAGDRMKAAQLLAMLQSLLENLHVSGDNGQAGNTGGNSAADQALRGLGDLMGRQRELLDKTFRQSEGNGDPRDGGAPGLSRQQGQLRGDLQTLRRKSGRGAPNLERAERLMDEAGQALGLGDLPRATTLQKYVLEELRQAADALARASQGRQGAGQDPLGRNTGNSAAGGGDIRIPDASVLKRARDILMELRRRAGQQGRPQEERDYIDRLLRRF